MIAIVCVDDNDGIAFQDQRQSQDSIIYCDIINIVHGQKLWMTNRSISLFQPDPQKAPYGFKPCITENPMAAAAPGEFVFLDADMPDGEEILRHRPEALVIYKWNTIYPADRYLNIHLLMKRISTQRPFCHSKIDLCGNSHPSITREIAFFAEEEFPDET